MIDTIPAARIKLGVPSKGRLRDATADWFAAHGIGIENAGSSREYAGHVTGVEGVDLVLLSAGEIPRELAAGRIHLGVTGEDLVHEKIPDWQDRLSAVAHMGFGHADLIIAVPTSWVDVETVADLDEACAAFRAAHGQPLRIATKYHALARRFLKRAGVADYRLVDSQGATEGVVRNQAAEAIIDITSSGETLRANHLKVLSDGLILASQATLWRAVGAPLAPDAAQALEALTQRLGVNAA